MHEKSLHVKILFTTGVVDPVEKPNKRQSNPELLDSPLLLDIGSVEKVNESFNKSAGQVERHRASKGNEGLHMY